MCFLLCRSADCRGLVFPIGDGARRLLWYLLASNENEEFPTEGTPRLRWTKAASVPFLLFKTTKREATTAQTDRAGHQTKRLSRKSHTPPPPARGWAPLFYATNNATSTRCNPPKRKLCTTAAHHNKQHEPFSGSVDTRCTFLNTKTGIQANNPITAILVEQNTRIRR